MPVTVQMDIRRTFVAHCGFSLFNTHLDLYVEQTSQDVRVSFSECGIHQNPFEISACLEVHGDMLMSFSTLDSKT